MSLPDRVDVNVSKGQRLVPFGRCFRPSIHGRVPDTMEEITRARANGV